MSYIHIQVAAIKDSKVFDDKRFVQVDVTTASSLAYASAAHAFRIGDALGTVNKCTTCI